MFSLRGMGPSSQLIVYLLNCVRDFTRYLRIFITLAINGKSRRGKKETIFRAQGLFRLIEIFHVAGASRTL